MDRGGKSRGYGFVVFDNPIHAQLVLSQVLHWIDGKSINVGPVHEKRMVTDDATPQQAQESQKKSSRSRSYSNSSSGSRSGSSSGTRSRSRSKEKDQEKKEVVVPLLGEPEETPEEPEQDPEDYQREVEEQAAKIEEAEKKAKTLQQRRAERRAR